MTPEVFSLVKGDLNGIVSGAAYLPALEPLKDVAASKAFYDAYEKAIGRPPGEEAGIAAQAVTSVLVDQIDVDSCTSRGIDTARPGRPAHWEYGSDLNGLRRPDGATTGENDKCSECELYAHNNLPYINGL